MEILQTFLQQKQMSNRGVFITFEGGEGAGKTTLIAKLEKELLRRGETPLLTREPGGTFLGEEIRQMVLGQNNQITPYAELLLFLAARAQHVEQVIKPALSQGKIVLCDRFNDSTIAYQGFARGLGVETVEHLCKLACQGCIPDLTFYLDIDPAVGMERARKQQRVMDRMENEKKAFHDKVRQGFLNIAKQDEKRICVIDAMNTEQAVYDHVLTRLIHKISGEK